MDLLHLHLLLNHFPVVAITLSAVLLAVAVVRKSRELGGAAVAIILVSALVVIVVFLTGEPAEERVEHLPGVSHEVIERHEEAGKLALAGTLVLAAAALPAGALLVLRRQSFPRAWMVLPLVCAVFATGLLGWTANLGGQIRHTELSQPHGHD